MTFVVLRRNKGKPIIEGPVRSGETLKLDGVGFSLDNRTSQEPALSWQNFNSKRAGDSPAMRCLYRGALKGVPLLSFWF